MVLKLQNINFGGSLSNSSPNVCFQLRNNKKTRYSITEIAIKMVWQHIANIGQQTQQPLAELNVKIRQQHTELVLKFRVSPCACYDQ